MTRSEVDKMLGDYRRAFGVCGHLEAEIHDLQGKIKVARYCMADDLTRITPPYTDMPRGGRTGDQTSMIGGKLADGGVTEEVERLEGLLEAAKREYSEAQSVMLHVQGWLRGLGDPREKWLIEKQVIDGVCWRMLVPMYERKFGEGYTRDGLRKMRNRALEKIYRIAAGKRESKG